VLPGFYLLYANMAYRPPADDGGTTGRGAAQPAPAPEARGSARGQAGQRGPGGQRGQDGAPPPVPIGVRTPLNVGYAHVEDLRLTLAAGADLSGKARMEGGAAEIPRGFTVSLARDPDIVGAPSPQGRGGAIQPDGTFTLNGVGPDDYRVLVAPFITAFQWAPPSPPKAIENAYVKSIRYDGLDVLADGLHLASVSILGDLEIVFGAGGSVSGAVVNERRDALANVTVALVPETQYRKRMDLYRTASTDSLGRFRIAGVAPGFYKAFAWEQVDRNAWQVQEFLAEIENRGIPVDVREGGDTTTDIAAIPSAKP
jgi:hypothetical protein